MEICTRSDGIRIIQIRSKSDALPYRASMTGAYQTVFADHPYNERFYPSEAEAVLYQTLQSPENITFLAIKGETRVVGFGFAVPVSSRPEIARQLRGLIPIKNSFYLAELGVLESFRRRGLGKQLTALRLQHINKDLYTHAVLRISVQSHHASQMYHSMNFEDMGVYSEISSRRINGSVRTDRRLFLSRLLEESN